ncbi:MAG: endonuclease/exonuclease/phosphatase family protein [Terrimicrobiaceae bacterium]|nr:endonuclease/exonuclease/phosphatase family protein [Terrimicrobiaceae bacterium]
MRILTYNVHGCVGMDGYRSYSRVASVIGSVRPDVVCLQELDAGRPRSAMVHQAKAIADLLGMAFEFHPAVKVRKEQYGNAILSRTSFRVIKTGCLPSAPSLLPEARGAIWVEVEGPTGPWQVFTTHLGLGRLERLRQAAALTGPAWLGLASGAPRIVLCGDLNSRPQSRVHTLFRQFLRESCRACGAGLEPTFSSRLPFIRLDYIYTSPDVAVGKSGVVRAAEARTASDHLAVYADLAG